MVRFAFQLQRNRNAGSDIGSALRILHGLSGDYLPLIGSRINAPSRGSGFLAEQVVQELSQDEERSDEEEESQEESH